jgi:HAD superfamily hydrolase (TIGR01509 family)
VEAVLAQIKHPFCVASNSDDKKLRMILGFAGLLPLFEGKLYSVDLVQKGKPDPSIFLHAAKAMGAKPARTLVIEDTPIGVTAGVAAGMAVFGYSELMSAERLKQAGAAQTFSNMSDLPGLIQELDAIA